eukprot:1156017-Pelagomonas_calceolata.AAC.7
MMMVRLVSGVPCAMRLIHAYNIHKSEGGEAEGSEAGSDLQFWGVHAKGHTSDSTRAMHYSYSNLTSPTGSLYSASHRRDRLAAAGAPHSFATRRLAHSFATRRLVMRRPAAAGTPHSFATRRLAHSFAIRRLATLRLAAAGTAPSSVAKQIQAPQMQALQMQALHPVELRRACICSEIGGHFDVMSMAITTDDFEAAPHKLTPDESVQAKP